MTRALEGLSSIGALTAPAPCPGDVLCPATGCTIPRRNCLKRTENPENAARCQALLCPGFHPQAAVKAPLRNPPPLPPGAVRRTTGRVVKGTNEMIPCECGQSWRFINCKHCAICSPRRRHL